MLLGYLDPGSGSILLQALLGVLVWVGGAILVARYSQKRGHGFLVIFLIGLLTTWLVSLALVLILNAREQPAGAAPGSSPDA